MNALEMAAEKAKESPVNPSPLPPDDEAAAAKPPETSPKGLIGFPKSIITDSNNEDEDIEVIHFGVV